MPGVAIGPADVALLPLPAQEEPSGLGDGRGWLHSQLSTSFNLQITGGGNMWGAISVGMPIGKLSIDNVNAGEEWEDRCMPYGLRLCHGMSWVGEECVLLFEHGLSLFKKF